MRGPPLVLFNTLACDPGAEYEWGVHVATFADKAHPTDEQIRSLTSVAPQDDCWSAEERLMMPAGTYRTVSYLVKSLRLPGEAGAATFADYSKGVRRP